MALKNIEINVSDEMIVWRNDFPKSCEDLVKFRQENPQLIEKIRKEILDYVITQIFGLDRDKWLKKCGICILSGEKDDILFKLEQQKITNIDISKLESELQYSNSNNDLCDDDYDDYQYYYSEDNDYDDYDDFEYIIVLYGDSYKIYKTENYIASVVTYKAKCDIVDTFIPQTVFDEISLEFYKKAEEGYLLPYRNRRATKTFLP